jgi:hypothetical protein
MLILKVLHPPKFCSISWSHVDWCKFFIHLRSLKIPPLPPSPYSKCTFKKIIIQTKLVGMSMIFYCTKLHLSKWNSSWVFSKTKMLILISATSHVRVCHFLQKLSNWKLFILWRSVTVENFMILRWLVQVLHPPQKYVRSPFWNGCSYGIRNYGFHITFNGTAFLMILSNQTSWSSG